uniref:potassium-transporting ATPase subunit KdpC n=1 Tax=Eubacterium sp. TaxID=142586 RepID=UPI004025FA0A
MKNNTKAKKSVFSSARQVIIVTLILLIICGLGFPLLLTGISSLIFPKQAEGNLVKADGVAVGSEFVGQDFTEDYFMKCRPSAYNYNTYYEDENGNKYYNDGSEFGGLSSGSNNYAPSNPELAERVEKDIEEFLEANPGVKREDIPTDLLTASGSGLDPHISPASAEIQIPAISQASDISEEELKKIVEDNTEGKLLGIFGEETVNVLEVNLEIAKEMGIVSNIEK